jgi:hypothetical protein
MAKEYQHKQEESTEFKGLKSPTKRREMRARKRCEDLGARLEAKKANTRS